MNNDAFARLVGRPSSSKEIARDAVEAEFRSLGGGTRKRGRGAGGGGQGGYDSVEDDRSRRTSNHHKNSGTKQNSDNSKHHHRSRRGHVLFAQSLEGTTDVKSKDANDNNGKPKYRDRAKERREGKFEEEPPPYKDGIWDDILENALQPKQATSRKEVLSSASSIAGDSAVSPTGGEAKASQELLPFPYGRLDSASAPEQADNNSSRILSESKKKETGKSLTATSSARPSPPSNSSAIAASSEDPKHDNPKSKVTSDADDTSDDEDIFPDVGEYVNPEEDSEISGEEPPNKNSSQRKVSFFDEPVLRGRTSATAVHGGQYNDSLSNDLVEDEDGEVTDCRGLTGGRLKGLSSASNSAVGYGDEVENLDVDFDGRLEDDNVEDDGKKGKKSGSKRKKEGGKEDQDD